MEGLSWEKVLPLASCLDLLCGPTFVQEGSYFVLVDITLGQWCSQHRYTWLRVLPGRHSSKDKKYTLTKLGVFT